MNRVLFSFAIKQLMSSPFRLAIAFLFFCMPLVGDIITKMSPFASSVPISPSTGIAGFMAWIIGAGIIGKDMSDGILPLIFSRPIKRYQYVLSKWVALSLVVILICLLNDVVHILVAYNGSLSGFSEYKLDHILYTVSNSFGAMAVMLALSAMLPGFVDFGILMLITSLAFFMAMLDMALKWDFMSRIFESIYEFVYPSISIGHSVSWQDTAFELSYYFAIVFTCLAIAFWSVGRKELPYGNE